MTPKINLKGRFTKKRITENIGLKVISLGVAIALWFIVVNVTDPVVTSTYRNVPVKLLNTGVITDNGKTLEVVDNSAVIPVVTIKASRTTIQELGSSIDNIVATADLYNLSSDNTSIPIDITTLKYSDKIDSIKASENTVYVSIENRKTIQLPLNATASGEIESGYILGDITPNQNQVRISGPESVVSHIKSASVDVQVTGFTGNISTQAEVLLFDEEGKTVNKDSLTLNVDSVKVDAEILATKKVPVYYATSGSPAEGYKTTGEADISPSTVVIAGSQQDIKNINTINIPASDINITGQTGDMYVVFDITEYLPDGIRLADSTSNGNVSVKVFIESLVNRVYDVHTKDISIENVPFGFVASFEVEDAVYEVVLRGLAQDHEKIGANGPSCYVDFDDYVLLNEISEFEEGTYTLYLSTELIEGIEGIEAIPVNVKLHKNE